MAIAQYDPVKFEHGITVKAIRISGIAKEPEYCPVTQQEDSG